MGSKSFKNYFLLVLLYITANCAFLCSVEVASYGSLYSATTQVIVPLSIQELQGIVKESSKKGTKICILGAGMSQGKHYLLTDSILVDMKHLCAMHLKGDLLTVEAGALWKDIQTYIGQQGYALQVAQGSNIFSVGGSLSVNCHGWDFHQGSLINTVKKISVINAKGEIKELTPSDPLFSHVIGGYGCFGIIVEAELQLAENFYTRELSKEIPTKDYTDYFYREVLNHEEILLHRYRLSVDRKNFFKTGIATNYAKIDAIAMETESGSDRWHESAAAIGVAIARNIPALKPALWKAMKADALKKKIVSRNQAMSPPAEFHFIKQRNSADWLQEFFIDKDHLLSFLEYLKGILLENDVNLLSTTVRFVKSQPDVGLAYSPNKDRFSVVLFFKQPLSTHEVEKTQAWVQKVVDYLIEYDGNYYLPYHHFATQEQFQKCYPNAGSFKSMKIEQDPDLVFYNGFYADYLEGS